MKKKLGLIFGILIIIFSIFIIVSKYYEKDDKIIGKYSNHTEYKIQVWQSAIYVDRYYYNDDIEDKILSKKYKKIGDNASLIEERINKSISDWNLESEISQEEINSLLNENNYYYLDDMVITEREYNFKLYIYNIEDNYLFRIENYF